MSSQKYFSTQEAKAYLGVSIGTIRHHVYYTKKLVPDAHIGTSLMFLRETLDHWAQNRPKVGRPRKKRDEAA